ncbi:NUDIX domain-containing protein [Kineosporia mesophila]|uniref:NUDIX domain-containing protein n=1 Tax=Kineosporia mesophila TaxID=566012 RepID=A0ABP7ANW1_9ACTN|nr:NUDIX domain-containing protein [Kineosporia mesophila]MCD5349413.1 NUDIX hydrolase [Kineosporia mesophila]
MSEPEWVPPSVLIAVDLVVLTLRGADLCLLLIERGIEPMMGQQALPGGFLSHDREELVTAARRELREETSIDLDSVHLELLGVYSGPERDPRGRVVSMAYLAIVPRLGDPEAGTDAMGARWHPVAAVLGGSLRLAFDHRDIVSDGVERARRMLETTTLATTFCSSPFSLSELQGVYEAVWGMPLDTRNFYRKLRRAEGFVVPAGPVRQGASGRPARLYRAGPSTSLQPPMVRDSLARPRSEA